MRDVVNIELENSVTGRIKIWSILVGEVNKILGLYLFLKGTKEKHQYYYAGKVNIFTITMKDDSFYRYQMVLAYN